MAACDVFPEDGKPSSLATPIEGKPSGPTKGGDLGHLEHPSATVTRVAAVTGEGEPTATQRLQPTAALAGSLSSPGSPEVSAGEEAAETERQQLRDVRAAVSMLSTSRCYREPDIRGLRAAALFQLRALALRWEQEVVLRMTSVDVPSVAGAPSCSAS